MQNTQVLAGSAAFVFDSIIRSKMLIKKIFCMLYEVSCLKTLYKK